MKWVIKTNFGYVAGSSGSVPIKVSYTDDKNEATYRSTQEARVWAADIMERAEEPVLFVQLESRKEQDGE